MTTKKNEIRVLDDLELKEVSGGLEFVAIAWIGYAVIVSSVWLGTKIIHAAQNS